MPGPTIGEADIKIGADGATFHRDLKKQTDSAADSSGRGFGAKFGSALGRTGAGIGKAFGGVIVGSIAAGVGGLAAVVATGLKESSEMQDVNAQFAAGIKSTGNAANLSVKGMDALAESIARTSGMEDDVIASTEKILQTFPMVRNLGMNKIFDQTTMAAADMAAKLGGDATKYAKQLGKALGDPTKGMGALSRSGVVFTEQQKKQVIALMKSGKVMEAQKIILSELNVEFGGAAAAAGKTMTGSLARVRRGFEDVSQSVMEGALPVITPMISKIAAALNTPAFQKGFKSFFSGAAEVITWVVTTAIPGLWRFGQAFVFPAISVIVGFFKSTVIPAVRAMVAAFVAGGDDVTSSGFAGFMEKVGLAARKLVDFVTSQLIPGLKVFFSFLNGNDTGVDGPFRQMAVAGTVARAVIAMLTDKLTTMFNWISSTGLPAMKTFATTFAIPAAAILGNILINNVVPAVVALGTAIFATVKFFAEHTGAAKALGVVVGAVFALLLAAWVVQRVQAGIATASIVKNWLQQATAATFGATATKKSMAQIAAGWVIAGAKAVAYGIKSAAVWIGQKVMVLASMAVTVASVVGGWLVIAATAVANAVIIAAQWVIAFWPIALVIAAVALLAVVIWKNFDNIKKWIGGAWTWVKEHTIAVWNSVIGFLSGIWASITSGISTAWNGIISWLTTTGAKIIDVITLPYRLAIGLVIAIIMILFNWIQPKIAWLVTVITTGFTSMWTKTVAVFTAIKDFIIGIWNTVVGFVMPLVTGFVNRLVTGWTNIWLKTVAIFNGVKTFLIGVWTAIWGFISGIAAKISGVISAAFNSIKTWIINAATSARAAASTLISNVMGAIRTGLSTLASIISGPFNAIKTWIGNTAKSAVTAAGALITKIKDAITGKVKDLGNIGSDIVHGLISGITGMGKTLMAAVKKFIEDHVPEPVRKLLKLGSPSRLFKDFGANIGQGLIDGIVGQGKSVEAATTGLARKVTSSFQTPTLALWNSSAGGSLASPKFSSSAQSLGTRLSPLSGAGGGSGISADQLSAILQQVLAKAKPDNKFDQTFNEKVDPTLLSKEIAWALR